MVWLCTEDSLYMFLILWATSLNYTVLWAASSPIYMIWHSHGNYCNCQHGKILVAYLIRFNLAVSTSSLLGAKCRQSSWSLQWGVTERTRVGLQGADRSTLWFLSLQTHKQSICAAKLCKVPLADGSWKEGLKDNYKLGVSIHMGFGQGVLLSESVHSAAHRRGLHT